MTYSKTDALIDSVGAYLIENHQIKLSKKKVRGLITAVSDAVFENITENGEATIPGLGTFQRHIKLATRRVNPRNTAQFINIPEKYAVRFIASSRVKVQLARAKAQAPIVED